MLMRINDKWRCYIGNGKAEMYKGRTKMGTLDVSHDLGNAVAAVRRWCIREGIIRKWEISDGSPTATV